MYINVSLSYASKLCVQFLFVVTLITSQHENIISRINNRLSFSRFVKNDIEILFYHGNDTHLLHAIFDHTTIYTCTVHRLQYCCR